MLILYDLIVLSFIYLYLYGTWKDRKILRSVFFLYMVLVAGLLILPVIGSLENLLHPSFSYNLIPYIDLIQKNGDYHFQIVMNLLITLPLGFFLKEVLSYSYPKALGKTILCITVLEIAQALLHSYRCCDITDIINNSIGMSIGYLLTVLLTKKNRNK